MGRSTKSYSIEVKPTAKKDLKNLKKKYRNIDKDITPVINDLEQNPTLGVAMTGFGDHRKIRVGSTDMNVGKRQGFRIITHPIHGDEIVEIKYIYQVAQKDDPSTLEIQEELKRRKEYDG